jgi:hypothetical protein
MRSWHTTLHEAISDNSTGRASSTRIIMLVAGVTLSFCTILLTAGSFWRIELVPALTVFGSALATMAGGGYIAARVTGKKSETA